MSKLPKAPLVEVVFELRWDVRNQIDLPKIQYLYGDIYNALKEKYPFRETISPLEFPTEFLINKPVHRYRTASNDYPLIQVGPGLLTLNTIDSKYYWDSFYESSKELVESFLNIFPFESNQKVRHSIIFLDFFPFDFNINNPYEFINDNFNIDFKQSFTEDNWKPKEINFGFSYEIPNQGDLSITFKKGKNSKNETGIVVETRINGGFVKPDVSETLSWINDSHKICSQLFKRLTEGRLYDSFKK